MNFRKAFVPVIALATILGWSAPSQAGIPDSGFALRKAASQMTQIEVAQYYWNGFYYCWYPNGWRGPGWYRCGYAWSFGIGWGGPWGWHGWRHYHHRHGWRHHDRHHDHDWRHRHRHHDHDRDHGWRAHPTWRHAPIWRSAPHWRGAPRFRHPGSGGVLPGARHGGPKFYHGGSFPRIGGVSQGRLGPIGPRFHPVGVVQVGSSFRHGPFPHVGGSALGHFGSGGPAFHPGGAFRHVGGSLHGGFGHGGFGHRPK